MTTLLGHDGEISYGVNRDKQLTVQPPKLSPEDRPCAHAVAFGLTGFEVSLHPDALFNLPGAIHLPVEQVTLEGKRVRVQTNGGWPNIGAWDDARERAHWLVWTREAGTYAVRAELSSAYGPSGLKTTLAGQSKNASVPRTKGWFEPVFVNLGRFDADRAGVYRLTLEPDDAETWKGVNVWQLQLARTPKRRA